MVLYVEMPADLKERLAHLAMRRYRKISAETIIAITEYLDREEAKERQALAREALAAAAAAMAAETKSTRKRRKK